MSTSHKLTRRIALEQLQKEIPALEKDIGYAFKDQSLLLNALTHRSYLNESQEPGLESNERLEFLGDSILSHIISMEIFTLDSGQEGHLSQLRSSLVDTKQCAQYCQILGLQNYLLFGRGLLNSGEKAYQHLCANLFEAVLAAVYLDSNFQAARTFFMTHFSSLVKQRLLRPAINWKAKLQSYCQKHLGQIPSYAVTGEKGPEHAKLFQVEIYVHEKPLGSGWGDSKQLAQVEAAKTVLTGHFNLTDKEICDL